MHTFGRVARSRTTTTGNPYTVSLTINSGETVVALLIKTVGGTNRAGAAPSWGASSFTQANSTQKAAASPEASAELWYLLNPVAGTNTLTVPNTGAASLRVTVVTAIAARGVSYFDAANGGNGTSTNPTPGAVTCSEPGDFVVAINANGATTWNPSAQAGTIIANTDDGAHGGGEQYAIRVNPGAFTLNWTFGTSDDWGAVVAAFYEPQAVAFQNYMGVDCVSDGVMSVTEKIR